jgi:hypothetical protein
MYHLVKEKKKKAGKRKTMMFRLLRKPSQFSAALSKKKIRDLIRLFCASCSVPSSSLSRCFACPFPLILAQYAKQKAQKNV